jgi:hypothetical protein
MPEYGAVIPDLESLGRDAEQVAALYPRRASATSDAWKASPVEIPDSLNKLAEGHCGYGR